MPTTPTLELCDDLVAHLLAGWADRGPKDGAERRYFARISDEGAARIEGRRVFVFPTKYDNGPENRGEDLFVHEIAVLVAERYTDAGDPPTEWIDERVDWVYEHVVQGLDFARETPAWNGGLSTTSADTQVADIEKLTTGGKLFYSLVQLVFAEVRDA